MALEQILMRYPELKDKLFDTERDNIKIITENNKYSLYLITDRETPFYLISDNGSFACEDLPDMDNYIKKQFPWHKGDEIIGMPWIAENAKIIAANNKGLVFVDGNGKYGIAYNSLYRTDKALFTGISLDLALKQARQDFGLLDNEHIYTENNIYELLENNNDYLILRDLSRNGYLLIQQKDIFYDDNIVSWEKSERFSTFQEAQTQAWQQYDTEHTDNSEALKEKIQGEYAERIEEYKRETPEEIISKVKQIYALESVKRAFDNESGIFMPKKTMEYLLKEDVSAIDELSARMADGDSVDFCVENVNTAIEEIQSDIEQTEEIEQLVLE